MRLKTLRVVEVKASLPVRARICLNDLQLTSLVVHFDTSLLPNSRRESFWYPTHDVSRFEQLLT